MKLGIITWILTLIERYVKAEQARARALRDKLGDLQVERGIILEQATKDTEVFERQHREALQEQANLKALSEVVRADSQRLKEKYEEIVAERLRQMAEIRTADPDTIAHFDFGLSPGKGKADDNPL
jgi:4-alpha-glucanotransferase